MFHRTKRLHHYRRLLQLLFIIPLFGGIMAAVPAAAQDEPATGESAPPAAVQVLEVRLGAEEFIFAKLEGLSAGDTLYVYAGNLSGNVDPLVAVADSSATPEFVEERLRTEYDRIRSEDIDPRQALFELGSTLFLAADDDSGTGHDAALQMAIPSDGDYWLVLTTSPFYPSDGAVQIQIGINAPEVLAGLGTDNGAVLVRPTQQISTAPPAVQRFTASVDSTVRSRTYELADLSAGDTLYIHVQATTPDLRPALRLQSGSGKLITADNWTGTGSTAAITYPARLESRNLSMTISGCCPGNETAGDYEVLVGVNAPDVLTGAAEATGAIIVKEPTTIEVSVRVEQITGVDQQAENFAVVAVFQAWWQDPALAYDPSRCQCSVQSFSGKAYESFITRGQTRWPEFSVINQQGQRWVQNQGVLIYPDGSIQYFERSSTTLQAPDFDFTQFPLDNQVFHYRVQTPYPAEVYQLTPRTGASGLGPQLGEEEWDIVDFEEEISTFRAASAYRFSMFAERKIQFYFYRFFIPIFLILLLSWLSFFLRSYDTRLSVTTGNLLLFIAFNFSIGGDLPRLGYLTFMDTILITAFSGSALAVFWNIYMKRLEQDDQKERAHSLDRYFVWVYPLLYVIAFSVLYAIYFLF